MKMIFRMIIGYLLVAFSANAQPGAAPWTPRLNTFVPSAATISVSRPGMKMRRPTKSAHPAAYNLVTMTPQAVRYNHDTRFTNNGNNNG